MDCSSGSRVSSIVPVAAVCELSSASGLQLPIQSSGSSGNQAVENVPDFHQTKARPSTVNQGPKESVFGFGRTSQEFSLGAKPILTHAQIQQASVQYTATVPSIPVVQDSAKTPTAPSGTQPNHVTLETAENVIAKSSTPDGLDGAAKVGKNIIPSQEVNKRSSWSSSGQHRPGHGKSCHVCKTFNNRKMGRDCDRCQLFFHLSCIGLKQRISAEIQTWHCHSCSGLQTSSDDSVQPATNPVLPIAEELLRALPLMRKQATIPVKIPKAARMSAADALSNTINQALAEGSDASWVRLFQFAVSALGSERTPHTSSHASRTKRRIADFMGDKSAFVFPVLVDPSLTQSSTPVDHSKIRRAVNSKLLQGDISAAVRIVTSDDSVIHPSAEVIAALRLKHPAAPQDLRHPPPADDSEVYPVNEERIMAALKSFRPGSSGGVDGLRPGHLKDLTAPLTAEAGARLRSSLTRLCNVIIDGSLPKYARDLLFSANLTALRKKCGGVRPIAVGNTLRRLASKAACYETTKRLSTELAPVQLGVGVPLGCEAAAHAIRSATDSSRTGDVLIKLDMTNAFNSVRRDHLLEVCHRRAPSIFRLARTAYAEPSLLLCGNSIISSESGVQQGDPIGPLLFSLAIDEIAQSCRSPINVWYLDDVTIGGPFDSVMEDIQRIVPALADIGLTVNPRKSELIKLNCDEEAFDQGHNSLCRVLGEVTKTELDDVIILGAPICAKATTSILHDKTEALQRMAERLEHIDAHPALFLLQNCLAMPKLLFTLRSAPCHTDPVSLGNFDLILRRSASSICNVDFDDTGWRQASLPVRFGGLGLRSATDLALPAYAASVHASESLVNGILSRFLESPSTEPKVTTTSTWIGEGLQLPSNLKRQNAWDLYRCASRVAELVNNSNQHRVACLKSAGAVYSGAWLTAIPSSSLGNLLDNDSIRIAVSQRLGLHLCAPHPCRCGRTVDEFGLHPLSCKFNAGRLPRHASINDAVKRGLDAAGFASVLEPVGLDRGDGRRPDGMTVFAYKAGKSLVWDATCTDTFAPSSIAESAVTPGSAARRAEERKKEKYAGLSDRFIVQPVAVETSGVLGPETIPFLREVGRSIAELRNEPREAGWLFQRISLAIVRGNALAVMSSSRSRLNS